MARTKQLPRMSTGPLKGMALALARKRQRLRIIARTPSPPSSPEPESHWLYVMVTLTNVANILREELQTPERVVGLLSEDDNTYSIFNIESEFETDPHIIVGRQEKSDGTYDMYIMVGIVVDENIDSPETIQIEQGLSELLAREGEAFAIQNHDVFIMRQPDDPEMVDWNIHIIHLMDESVEEGENLTEM